MSVDHSVQIVSFPLIIQWRYCFIERFMPSTKPYVDDECR